MWRHVSKYSKLAQGKSQIIEKIDGLKYPLKIVFSVHDDTITVMTAYPLKKRLRHESILG